MNSFLTRKQRKKYGLLRNVSRLDSATYSAFERTLDPGRNDDTGAVVYFCDDHDEEDEYELLQVRDRGAEGLFPAPTNGYPPKFIEKDIENGDSLPKLALRYGCSVAELKRVNNLISDQEFHALCKIKVPVKPYSLLTEHSRDNTPTAQTGKLLNFDDDNDDDTPGVQVRTLAIGDSLLYGPSEAFLRHMDEDLERIRRATCQYKSSLQEVAAELTCKRFHPFREQNSPTSHFIPLRALLAVGALVTLIVPIVIIILELQKDKHS